MLNLQTDWFETEIIITELDDGHLNIMTENNLGYRFYLYEVSINQVNMFFLYNYFFYLHENNFDYSFNQIYNIM